MKEKNFTISMSDVKRLLDAEVLKRDSQTEICAERLDPVMVARRHNDEIVSLICALFAYGGVKQIVSFLDSLDFSLLDADVDEIKEALKSHYYRFQKSEDVAALFIALKRLKEQSTLEDVFVRGYGRQNSVIEGIDEIVKKINSFYPHSSKGYEFLLSRVTAKTKGAGALKRWMLYLRWMVRDDNIDIGLWNRVDKKDLIIPLDTHTFNVSRRLGLLKRKTYDLQAAIELTCRLREFDESDPLKYDFAFYRIGQEKLLEDVGMAKLQPYLSGELNIHDV
ncbi:TIGR02757 family protein [Sulfurimonas sp. HSL-1716]|uniref:TIGR02757 family protein n=1 Tax=Hydrocurvibacter sulfurireducens TaxID=3131937 RepID=UPI0031F75FF3